MSFFSTLYPSGQPYNNTEHVLGLICNGNDDCTIKSITQEALFVPLRLKDWKLAIPSNGSTGAVTSNAKQLLFATTWIALFWMIGPVIGVPNWSCKLNDTLNGLESRYSEWGHCILNCIP